MKFYTKHGWKGEKYERGRDITDIAKLVRAELKEIAPQCKFSVTISRYAGGQSMTVRLMTAPFPAFNNSDPRHPNSGGYYRGCGTQLNKYQLRYEYDKSHGGYCNGAVLTKETWELMQKVVKVVDSYRYDDSDGMIDYFSTNFYPHFEIGRYDKAFEQR